MKRYVGGLNILILLYAFRFINQLSSLKAEKLKRIGSIQEESEVSPSQEETELVPSVSEPENLNELGLEDKENPEFHYVETKEDSDTELYELQESDLWKHTKPIKVVKDISKKLKARRAERRRLFIT